MYLKIDKCPVCNSQDFKNLLICKDYLVSGESFAINECNNCSLQFTNPRPENNELDKYYQSDNYISHSNKATNLVNHVYKFVRNFTLQYKLNLVKSISTKGPLLDIGCGTGEFLSVCKKHDIKINGVEPNEKARKKAETLLSSSLYDDLFSVQEKSTFKVITLWHVLEHLPELDKVIEHLKFLLKKGGRIVIAVPNNKSYDALKYKEFWAAYDVPRHLYHFNKSSFSLLASSHNLKVKQILPMKWDSFYVSMLSEKYKNTNLNYIRSMITGLKSNRYAKNHNNNYSSLIYILKK